MPIIKIPSRKGYYADYVDAFGKRHRTSLKTNVKKVAEMKFAEMLRRENLIKQEGVPNMSWEQFKEKFFAFINLSSVQHSLPNAGTLKLGLSFRNSSKERSSFKGSSCILSLINLQNALYVLFTKSFGKSSSSATYFIISL